MTHQGAEDESIQTSTEYVDPFDDVFGSAPSSPALIAQDGDAVQSPHAPSRPANDPSDVPRLRSIHVTNGYREGIAASKEQHIQEGFDEGYSLGAEVAWKAGYLLGALEAIYHALAKEMLATSAAMAGNRIVELAKSTEEVKRMLEDAEEELKVEKLFGKDYFGEDGIWIYDVPGQEDEHEITFANVAEAHPVIRVWRERLRELCKGVNLDLG
jgi:hypothetical protein